MRSKQLAAYSKPLSPSYKWLPDVALWFAIPISNWLIKACEFFNSLLLASQPGSKVRSEKFRTFQKTEIIPETHSQPVSEVQIPASKPDPEVQSGKLRACQKTEIPETQRIQLPRLLNSLPLTQFEELMFALKPPAGIVSPQNAPQGQRTIELLVWIEGPTGPGYGKLSKILEEFQLVTPSTVSAEERLSFAIAGSIDKVDYAKLKAITKILQDLADDTSISIIDIQEGSIKLTLSGSSSGLAKIKQLFEKGELTEIQDTKVLYVNSLPKEVKYPSKLIRYPVIEVRRPFIEVTGTPVTALPFEQQIDVMVSWAKQKCSKVVCVANVHMLMESRWNQTLNAVLEKADLVTPDGMPLVWVIRSMGIKNQDRVAGMDIFQAICSRAVEENLSIYLFGSTQKVLTKMKERLEKEYPSLQIAGLESPPFRPLTENENFEMIERINNSGAEFTFVSLGSPRQESWMTKNQGKIQSVMIGVGSVFPAYANLKSEPKWVRAIGLEWLYRLAQEPQRLFSLYFPLLWFALMQLLPGHDRQTHTKRNI